MPLLRPDGSEAISPTAHYTGYVWARNGLSAPGLATLEGRVLYESLRAPMVVSNLLGGGTLESYLLARHRAIDVLLERAIAERDVTQVVEVAAGMSGRGLRFSNRHGDRLIYVEADLPGMAARKRRTLARMGALSKSHRVRELDALREGGPQSLAEIVRNLDPAAGLAIVTEGLLGYLEPTEVRDLWRRFAHALAGFRAGVYISDIHIGELQKLQVKAFRLVLAAFVRGRVHLHFGDERRVVAALQEAGFASARVHRAHVLAAQPRGAGGDSGEGDRPADSAARMAHTLEAWAR
jgi:O-methyltransferase involved in polyketide biosynthesis